MPAAYNAVPHVLSLQGGERVVLNLSGRGDKDVNSVIKYLHM